MPSRTRLGFDRSTVLRLSVQGLVSAGVLGGVAYQTDLDEVAAALRSIHPGWIGTAVGLRLAVIHGRLLRLGWMVRRWAAVPWSAVLRLGFLAGLLDLVLPARGGDLVLVGALNREHAAPVAAGVGAVMTTNVVTGALTAATWAGVLAWVLPRLSQLAGDDPIPDRLVGIAIGFGVLVAGVAFSLRRVRQTRASLEPRLELGGNVAVGAVQLGASLGSTLALFPALELSLELPIFAAVAFLMLANTAATVLPELLGAPSVGSGWLILVWLGAASADAAAFALLAWLTRVLPLVVLGLPLVPGRVGGWSARAGT